MQLPRLIQRKILGEVLWAGLLLSRGELEKNGYYDRLTDLVLRHVLTPTSLCVDVGCHAGAILRLMLKYSPNGRFLAFEPLPDLHAMLRQEFNRDNVSIYDIALSDVAGVSTFNHVMSNPGYSGLRKRRYDRTDEVDRQIEVRTETLDRVVAAAGIERVSLIKIDVEGAEYLVLKGAEQTIRKSRPVIIFEHGLGGSDHYGRTPDDLFALLHDECGLRISLMPDYLLHRPALSLAAFRHQFYGAENYYFVAHP